MNDINKELFVKYTKYKDVLIKIGADCIPVNELEEDAGTQVSELYPIVIVDNDKCYIDMAIIRELIIDLLDDMIGNMSSCVFDFDTVNNYVVNNFAGKTITDISEIENEEHQTYRYLYEKLHKEFEQLSEEFHTQRFSLQQCERELALKNSEIKKFKDSSDMLDNSKAEILNVINNFLNEDISISNVYAAQTDGEMIITASDKMKLVEDDEITYLPAVYNFSRPSFFTELKCELNKENAAKKEAKNTSRTLLQKLLFSKRIKDSSATVEEKASEIDKKRHDEIVKLLNDTVMTNEEKYLKYMLLTPGISKDYIKTLDGASDLGINANIVIKLLEQPDTSFNKEMIEAYVSKAHKGNEYNFKRELAQELIRGEWFVYGDVNGIREKFQLVPLELLQRIEGQFKQLSVLLQKRENAQIALNKLPDSVETINTVNVNTSDENFDAETKLDVIDNNNEMDIEVNEDMEAIEVSSKMHIDENSFDELWSSTLLAEESFEESAVDEEQYTGFDKEWM